MSFLYFFKDNARWIAGCFLLTFLSTTGQTIFISLSAGHIRSEYDLSNGAWGVVYMIGTLASAMTLPYLGQIVDRLSIRRVVLLMAPMLALAAALMALSTNVVLLVITIYLLRLFGQGMFPHAAYTATARWFSAQRGKALSLVILGHNAGDALFTNIFVMLALWIGWRNGWLVAAGLVLIVALPVVSVLVAVDRTPRSSDPVPRLVDARDWTRAEVLRDPMFYLAMTGIMAPGFIVTVAIFHQVHLVELRGWSLEIFASAFIVWAATNSVFTIVSGQLIDRFSGLALLPFVLLPLGAGCIVLGTVTEPWTPFAFMALVGMSNGMCVTLFGAVWPEFYGIRHLGSIRALVVSAGVFASAAGPGLTGFMIDAGISFPGILVVMGVYCFAISLVMLHVARRVRARN
ncbi:MFS transporter [Arvimicrobium flavum]|uniref:MFS transporter n=1 Tax=Arvimicrobium flavum TaxID=3393320 RepID=UPI00237B6175|nr:MFS transporter [Mesorhizobium shangrilense]